MVVGNLFGQFDKMVWNVFEVFGGVEHVSFQLLRLRILVTLQNQRTLDRAKQAKTAADRVGFVGFQCRQTYNLSQ